jgi:uncharacterized Zn finger protein
MCKHVAAALYGVGARLDSKPELLFVLRGVESNDLLSAGPKTLTAAAPATGNVLDDGDVAALFGLEMADTDGGEMAAAPAPVASGSPTQLRRSRAKKAATTGRRGATGKPPPGKNAKARTAAAGKASSSARAKGTTAANAVNKSGRNSAAAKAAPAKPRTRTRDVAARARNDSTDVIRR